MSTEFLVDNLLHEKSESLLMSDVDSEDTSSDMKDSMCDSPSRMSNVSCDDKPTITDTPIRSYANLMRHGTNLSSEMCCAKCGHFQSIKRLSPTGSHPCEDNDHNTYDFKCIKCGCSDTVSNNSETVIKEHTKPLLKFSVSAILEFMQPQHFWPYIQQNLLHHHNHLPHPTHQHHHHHHHLVSANNLSDNDNLMLGSNGNPGHALTNLSGHPNLTDCGNEENRVEFRDKAPIVLPKPLASRPPPTFLHHAAGLNHPHLHTLLAHCRNPYIGVGPGTQVFPLPPGQGFPWAHSSRGKPRRGMMRRAVFSDSQRKGLEKRFQMQKYISKPDRKKLAERLGLKDSQVKIWFRNRRMKWRNSKERELLANGGSRDQTLPNKNNPNPDLSDAQCDRAQSISPASSPNDNSQMQTSSSPVSSQSMNNAAVRQQQQSVNTPCGALQSIISKVTTPPQSQTTDVTGNRHQPEFKFNFNEHSRQRQLMTNFYDHPMSVMDNETMDRMHTNGLKCSNNNEHTKSENFKYYDEYESQSDDSDEEEINVT